MEITNSVTLEEILALSEELTHLNYVIDSAIIPLNRSTYLFEKAKLELKLQEYCFSFLGEEDSHFKKRLLENRELICNTDIVCKAYKTSVGYRGSHAKSFTGSIHNNGYLYLETETTNTRLDLLGGFITPVQYRGHLNPLGNAQAVLRKTKLHFPVSRIPREFLGSIDMNGNFEITTSVSESEFWSTEQYVSRIVADPFKGDADKTDRFLENKEVLATIYQDFCKTKLKL